MVVDYKIGGCGGIGGDGGHGGHGDYGGDGDYGVDDEDKTEDGRRDNVEAQYTINTYKVSLSCTCYQ